MPDKYEVSFTIGVRQANMGPGSFQASETVILEATGFTGLMDMLSLIHEAISQLQLQHGEPQDASSGDPQAENPGRVTKDEAERHWARAHGKAGKFGRS